MPSYFNSWISFQALHNNIIVGREKVWAKHTSLCDTTLYFFYELISPSTCIAAVCSQYMFLITQRSFPSIFNCVSCLIISSCCTLSEVESHFPKHQLLPFPSRGRSQSLSQCNLTSGLAELPFARLVMSSYITRLPSVENTRSKCGVDT